MSISVRRFLDMMPEFNLLAGQGGLGRRVRAVVIIDVPEGEKWISGNELILTSGYIFQGDTDRFKQFMVTVSQKNAAGLAIKTSGRFLPVSQEMLDLADRLDFPIINVPPQYPYVDIISPVIEEIAARRRMSEYRNLFIASAISDSGQTLTSDLLQEALGWKGQNGIFVLLLQTKHTHPWQRGMGSYDEIIPLVLKAAGSSFANLSYAALYDKLVFLVEPAGKEPARQQRAIRAFLDGLRSALLRGGIQSFQVGCGSVKPQVKKICLSYQEAELAVEVGALLHRENFAISFDELGSYRLLFQLRDDAIAEDFIQNYLGPLLEWDRQKGTRLLPTLSCIAENDWNLKDAANQLFVHYNTLRNRYATIQDLLGGGPFTAEAKLNLQLAIRFYHLRADRSD